MRILYPRRRQPPPPPPHKTATMTLTSIAVAPSQSSIVYSGTLSTRSHTLRRRRRSHVILRDDGTLETHAAPPIPRTVCVHNTTIGMNSSKKSITIHPPQGWKRSPLTLYANTHDEMRRWYNVLTNAANATLECHYRCGEILATTLHSTITAVQSKDNDMPYILKSVSKTRSASASAVLAWVGKNITHFAVVPFVDVFETPTHVHVVMPNLRAGSLCSLIRKGLLSIREARRIFKCVVKAVGYLHTKGLVHWGIRSERILLENVRPPHRPRLVGFGDARRFVKGKKLELTPHFHYMSSGKLTMSDRSVGSSNQENAPDAEKPDTQKPDSQKPSAPCKTLSESGCLEEDDLVFSAYSSHYNTKSRLDSFSSGSSASFSSYTTVDPHFASPEMLSGTAGSYPTECDLWALGVLLFEMVYGQLPFSSSKGWDYVAASVLTFADMTFSQRRSRLFSRVGPPSSALAEDAEKLIMELLNPDPESRPKPGSCLKHQFLIRPLRDSEGEVGLTDLPANSKRFLRRQSVHIRKAGMKHDQPNVRRTASLEGF